jgi:hypothetical protein
MKNMLKRLLALFGIDSRSDEDIVKVLVEHNGQAPLDHNPSPDVNEGPSAKEPPPNAAIVQFIVTDGGQVTINMNWTTPTKPIAEALGILLCAIHNGKLSEKCRAILAKSAHDDPNSRQHLMSILEYWDTSDKKYTPLVKPSEVFQLGRQKVRDQHLNKTNIQDGEIE